MIFIHSFEVSQDNDSFIPSIKYDDAHHKNSPFSKIIRENRDKLVKK